MEIVVSAIGRTLLYLLQLRILPRQAVQLGAQLIHFERDGLHFALAIVWVGHVPPPADMCPANHAALSAKAISSASTCPLSPCQLCPIPVARDTSMTVHSVSFAPQQGHRPSKSR